jgi:hypothetical protein
LAVSLLVLIGVGLLTGEANAQRRNQPNNYCPGAHGTDIRVFAQLQGGFGLGQHATRGFIGGLGAGVQIGGFTYLGLYGQALMANDVTQSLTFENQNIEPRLSYQEAGAYVRYSPIGFSWLRLLMGSRIGIAHAVWNDVEAEVTLEETGVQATPLIGLEVPLQRYARLEAGGGYRFSELSGLPQDLGQFSGFTAYFMIRFGNF